ncbi:MAG: DNA adenine methylase [Chloroflexi bacterium]|nr:DNA adenine methylase [Chloroflexota bacterium]
MNRQQSLFDSSEDIEQNVDSEYANKVINVASVPMRSPFRYPGGKTWLVPYIRTWLRERGGSDKELIETFAGGGIVSLTAIFEQLVGRVTLVELDEDVAAVWQVITTGDAKWLADEIVTFDLTVESAHAAIAQAGQSLRTRAFATIVKNRVNRGGILAEGASFVKQGENGKGIRSRWYPITLKHRIVEIDQLRDKIKFIHGDAFEVLRINQNRKDSLYFIDPPYVKAGGRLYRHSTIDHLALFEQASHLAGDFLITYDDHEEIRELANRYGFEIRFVAMKSTHHVQKNELLIGRDLSWL